MEHAATRKDIDRLARAFVEQFIASDAQPPKVIVLDLDPSEDETHGQQEFAFYNHPYSSHCDLPLFIFEGLSGKFITAVLRPGKRPTGAENAMILKRVVKLLRAHWPQTHLVIRGDSPFANPELMPWAVEDPPIDFIFGLANNAVLKCLAAPTPQTARELHETRTENAARAGGNPPPRTCLYTELDYAAGSWPQPFRVILKAEVTAHGDNPRFVVTSLEAPPPEEVYRDLYGARGQDENFIKRLKNDRHSDRTSDSPFLANHRRLF